MRYVLFLSIGLLVAGCATSGMTSEQRSEIPANATAVELHSDKSADAFYQDAYRHLRRKGFRIAESNKEMRDLSTEGKSVGSSQTPLRVDLFVEPTDEGSVLTASAEYELMRGNWKPVAFKDSGTKYKVGFEELVLLLQNLPHQRMEYVVNEERAQRAFSVN